MTQIICPKIFRIPMLVCMVIFCGKAWSDGLSVLNTLIDLPALSINHKGEINFENDASLITKKEANWSKTSLGKNSGLYQYGVTGSSPSHSLQTTRVGNAMTFTANQAEIPFLNKNDPETRGLFLLPGLHKNYYNAVVEDGQLVALTKCLAEWGDNCWVTSYAICKYIKNLFGNKTLEQVYQDLIACQNQALQKIKLPASLIEEVKALAKIAKKNYIDILPGNKGLDTGVFDTPGDNFTELGDAIKNMDKKIQSGRDTFKLDLDADVKTYLLKTYELCKSVPMNKSTFVRSIGIKKSVH